MSKKNSTVVKVKAPSDLKEIIKAEYKKCAQDPVHFMRQYCMIQHPTKGKVYFDLYQFQERTLNEFANNQYNVVLKSRQMGISTLVAGYTLWRMTFNSDYNVLVIATKQDVAKNLVTKVRVMHEKLPSWLRSNTVEDNKLSLRYANGSQIKAVGSRGDSGRSEALSLLVIDEAAFVDRIDEIWASAQQTLATGGDAVILSTPNGTGNFFHKTWLDGENGRGGWNPIRLHWSLHPERDQAWRDQQTELLGEKLAAQECDCDFISSGHTVVDGPIIQWYENTHMQPAQERRGPGGDIWIWKYPDYSKDYIITADVARGDGSDYSTFHIIDVEAVEQVAEYKGQIGTTEFGHMLVNMATEYNNALLSIENSGVGWAVVQVALDRKYDKLFYSYRHDAYVDDHLHLHKAYDLKDKSKMVPGFTTSTRTRPLLVSKLETYFREKTPVIRSKRLIDELYVFIWTDTGRPEAQRGYNDDLVMAFGMALWLRDTALKLRQRGLDLNRKALTHMKRNEQVMSTRILNQPDTWTMPGARGNREDLRWLL